MQLTRGDWIIAGLKQLAEAVIHEVRIIQSVEQDDFSLEQLLQISIHRDKKIEIGIYAWDMIPTWLHV